LKAAKVKEPVTKNYGIAFVPNNGATQGLETAE
jgi:hypothetical protein